MPTINVNANGTVDKVPFPIYKTSPSEPYWGRGIDGPVVLSSGKNLNTQICGTGSGGRTVDAPVTTISVISGTTLTVASTTNFRDGDYAIVMNMLGDSTNFAQVGLWELVRITTVASGTSLIIGTALTKIYGQTGGVPSNSTPAIATQKVQIQRVPEYTSITGASSLTGSAWNGSTGGLVALMCWDLNITGAISANAIGYRANEGIQGVNSAPSNNNGKAGTAATTASVGPSTATADCGGGGGGGTGGSGMGGMGGSRLVGTTGLTGGGGGAGGGGGGGAAPAGQTPGGTGGTGTAGGTQGAAGTATAPGAAGAAGTAGGAGGAGGTAITAGDNIDTVNMYIGGGGADGGGGGIGPAGGGGGSSGFGTAGGRGGSGAFSSGAAGAGGVIIFAKNVNITSAVATAIGGSVANPALTTGNFNGQQGSLAPATPARGGGGGGGGFSSGGAGAGGAICLFADYINAPTFDTASGSVTALATGGAGGAATSFGGAGGPGGGCPTVSAVPNHGRTLIRYIKAAALPVSSSVPVGVGNYTPQATTYKGAII